MDTEAVVAMFNGCHHLSLAERVKIFNEIQKALGSLVSDACPDPACSPQLVAVEHVTANDYNPNKVASPEMGLLEQSIRADGLTMPVVVVRGETDGDFVIVDGFHRRCISADKLGREYIPCSVIDSPMAGRMASTVRHNRARGKHQIELMAALVKSVMELGLNDKQTAEHLGMTEEELLRLRQMVGAAKMMAGTEYSKSWGNI